MRGATVERRASRARRARCARARAAPSFWARSAQRHPGYSDLRALAAALAELTGASVGLITEGANAAGAYLAGAVPHREPGGAPSARGGLSARAMLESRLKAYVLFGGIDPADDLAGAARGACAAASSVVAVDARICPRACASVAHVVLPIGSFAESSGTFVNVEGRWQSWAGAARAGRREPPGLEGAARAREPAERARRRLS